METGLLLLLILADYSLAIDFGYHPSAEEFDTLLRSHIGRNLIQRRVQDTRRFVPRYQHQTSIRFEPPELDFQLFDQEEQPSQPYVFESVEDSSPNSVSDQLHVQSELLEIKEPTTRRPPAPGNATFPIYFTHPTTGIVYQISQVGQNGGLPAVSQSRNDSHSIAVYVTKAQYDADVESLRRKYEQNCQWMVPPGTVISTLNPVKGSSGPTARPQIIRLKKPKNPLSKPSNKLPKPNHRPPPVMVTSGPIDHVSGQILKLPHRGAGTTSTTTSPSTTHRPNIRRKKRKKKKQNKNKVIKRRPGYGGNNTRTQPGHLPIILGKRPTGSSSSMTPPPPVDATQLEKPHLPQATLPTGNVFSQHLFRTDDELLPESENPEDGEPPEHLESLEPLEPLEALNLRRRRSLDSVNAEGVAKGANGGTFKDRSRKQSSQDNDENIEDNSYIASTRMGFPGQTKKRAGRGAEKGIQRKAGKGVEKGVRKSVEDKGAEGGAIKVARRPPLHLRYRRSLEALRNVGKPVQGTIVRRAATLSSGQGVTKVAEKVAEKALLKSGEKETAARRVNTPRRRSPKRKSGKRKTNQQTPNTPSTQKKEGPSSVHHLPTAIHLLHRNHSHEEHANPNPNPNAKESPKESPKVGSIGKKKSKTKERRRGRPETSGFDLLELLSDGDYEDEDEDYYYDGERGRPKPNRSTSSTEAQSGLKEDSSSAEEGADFGAMVVEETTTPKASSSEEEEEEEQGEPQGGELDATSSTKNSMAKKKIRIKRRPLDSDEDYDDDEDSGIGGFFRMIFYPVQVAMSRLMDGFSSPDEDEDVDPPGSGPTMISKYPSYTLYHSAHSNEAYAEPENDKEDEDDDDDSPSLGGWFSSWFGLQRRTKKIGSSTTSNPVLPVPTPPKEPPGWLESWFGFGKTTTPEADTEDDYDKWFSSWFESKPKRKVRRRSTTSTTSTSSTTTTTTTPSAAQVPILTIVDPLRNPQNWIGILAHHIVNSTGNAMASTTTSNPLLQALATRMATRGTTTSTSTTTPRPDLPRHISYDKYQIWRLKPQDETQVRVLEEFKKGEDGVKMHWLKGPSLRGLTDVLVPPKMLVDFQGSLNYEGIAHEVLIFDVGKAIAYERSKEDYLHTTRPSKPRPPNPAPMTWNRYHNHDEIVKYLETVRMKHPQLVELIHIGRSYEGRPLIVVKIESKLIAAAGTGDGQQTVKRPKRKRKSGQANAVFVEAGAQGLAWIGPATATWMIAELLRLMKSNKSNEDVDFIRNTTWYVMPVLNPDGYAYSHEYDRFWRKSRSQHQTPPPSGILDSAMTWLQQKRGPEKVCYGVDLDRNWLYHWGKRGSSKAPCNEFYAGPAPFSEPETKAVSDFLMDYRTQIKLYISLQAYGQVVSYPVKANSTFNSERLDDFLDVAMVGTDGLRKKGSKSRYKVDAANDLIEQRSGCADAFAAYEIGIPFSYTLQLADNGVHGYLLPSSSIEPTARDAFEIISGMLDYI